MKNGYDVAFRFPDNELFVLPITPAQIKMSVGSNNEVVTLINGGDINIPKSPQLIEISFKARFPMRQYPYAKEVLPYQNYFEKFKKVKEDRKPFTFLVARETPRGIITWDTELTVLLESFDIDEDAENGDDVIIEFELKQYKNYGTKSVDKPTPPRTEKTVEEQGYIIQKGDTLWGIAKKFYGNGAYWTAIYNYNKSVIEAEAKRRGLASSDNGHWIFAGCKIMIPNATVANQNTSTVVYEDKTPPKTPSETPPKTPSETPPNTGENDQIDSKFRSEVMGTLYFECIGVNAAWGVLSLAYVAPTGQRISKTWNPHDKTISEQFIVKKDTLITVTVAPQNTNDRYNVDFSFDTRGLWVKNKMANNRDYSLQGRLTTVLESIKVTIKPIVTMKY